MYRNNSKIIKEEYQEALTSVAIFFIIGECSINKLAALSSIS